jgi:polyhydroxyalkanoate synthesis regulator protein
MEYLLKRYTNRRLYDPQQGRNVTIEEVAELVRSGKRPKIVDNVSGRDVTLRVLGQAFLGSVGNWSDREKSKEILWMLISKGGDESVDILKKTVLASLGAMEITRQKAEEVIDELIRRGEVAKSKRSEAIVELLEKAEKTTVAMKDKVVAEVEEVVEKMKVAKKKDLDALETKVDELIATMKRLEEKLGK